MLNFKIMEVDTVEELQQKVDAMYEEAYYLQGYTSHNNKLVVTFVRQELESTDEETADADTDSKPADNELN